MFSILDPRLLIVAVVLCAASSSVGYWRGHTNGAAKIQAQWGAEKLAAQQAAIAKKEDAASAAHSVSADYQKGKAIHDEKVRDIKKATVRTVIVSTCFDDAGVRNINTAISDIQ